MRPRTLLPLLVLLALAGSLAACGSNRGPGGRRLSFAAMQAINPGVEGEWIIAEYPFMRNMNRYPDGTVKSLGYQVEDPQGKGRPVMFHFDETGMLTRKQYGGPIVRPPPPDNVDFKITGGSTPGGQAQHPQWSPAGYSQSGGGNAGPTLPGPRAPAPRPTPTYTTPTYTTPTYTTPTYTTPTYPTPTYPTGPGTAVPRPPPPPPPPPPPSGSR